MDRKWPKFVREYGMLVVGAFCMSVAYVLFLIPSRIAPGGVGGLSIILHYQIGVPVGITMLVLNVPIFLLGVKELGKQFGVRTVIATVLLALMTDGLSLLIGLEGVTENTLLACLYGGIILGVGLGLVFRGRGSTAGTDIIGRVIHRRTQISTGMAILGADAIVIATAGVAFHSAELALYALVAVYLSSRAIDVLLEGWDYAKAAYIMSLKPGEIADAITDRMERGVTSLQSRSVMTGEKREVLFSVIHRRQVPRLRELVREIDPDAFVVISNVHEVVGKGFPLRVT
ncbi:hypothetical protein AMJ39_04775 [candidate division TA06 bacterium DG_24]|jgi:uncharacterized membrane-anchored protein YitT (DUF2179 family)|uniref:DUF2179 domain-containing protein n=2 Tax=Bacteria division TA06 TaxID=1156500 RepID=A0A0S8GGR9_UNCT6|nr:MAG: hypothetical protein AMJ39_04775 [candidate division TA06 bacterium DG_24]KPK71540.1 MAG: hypothetical protein AMJ82_00855 [candidate division TA06 bacterium SM23_40]